MRILHIGATDILGGASRAAYRLHCSLRECGVESRMLVRRKFSQDDDVTVTGEISPFQNLIEKITPPVERAVRKLTRDRTGSMWTIGIVPSRLASIVNDIDTDVVHLHWMGNGFLPIRSLPRIKHPVVWTFHDLWPVLGVNHYENNGRRPGGNPKKALIDLERIIAKKKQNLWGHLGVHVIGPSPWVIEELEKRGNRPAWSGDFIPHGLDTSIFKPRDTEELKKEMGIDPSTPVIVFGALGATSDPRKGGDLLDEMLQELAHRRVKVHLVVFGDQPEVSIPSHGFGLTRLGSIFDDARLAEVYSMGDLFLLPSREETFGQTASESLACGTPVVGFRATGQASVYRHKHEGYQADPYSPQDLANGVEWFLQQKRTKQEWQNHCRSFACKNYSLEDFALRHIDVYNAALAESQV